MGRLLQIIGGATLFTIFWYLIIFIVLIVPDPVRAQTVEETTVVQCAPYAQLVGGLEAGYGEILAVTGTIDAVRMETCVNSTTLTWTVIVVRPDGTACMLASGMDFAEVPNV